MPPVLPQRIKRMAMMLLMSFLATDGIHSLPTHPQVVTNAEHMEDLCPPCELFFSKLERTGRSGQLSQHVTVQERGEPKSGTGVSYYWATAALIRACDYFQDLFGEGSCRIDSPDSRVPGQKATMHNHGKMIFEPSLSSRGARCSCEKVERVSITTQEVGKHKLPVNLGCAFSHRDMIVVGRITKESHGHLSRPPCKFKDGTHPENYNDLQRCMHEANCDITDDRLQMAIFRDPRPAVVSTFYHLEVHEHLELGHLDAFVARELPILCQWLAVRYILFSGILADQSMELWYEDAMVDPLGWHYQWLHSVGLQLPFHVVEATAKAAVADNLGFKHKAADRHPGEDGRTKKGVRRFEEEVSPESVDFADDVLRTWLPPLLLERLGVEP